MKRSFSWLTGRLLLSTALLFAVTAGAMHDPRAAHAQAVLVVDDDGRGTAADCNAQQRTFSSVQAAVNAAQPGTSIMICPGTYAEQVVVAKNNLTLRGSGQGATVLRPTTVSQTVPSLLLPAVFAPIVLIDGAADVTVSGLTIDGSVAESGVSTLFCPQVGFYVGLYFRNASGIVDSARITTVNSSTRCSDGVHVEGTSTGASNLFMKNSMIDQNGNFGVVCVGPGTACTITGNSVRGRGSVADQLQAGIVIRGGATATITGNIVRDHTFSLAQGVPTKSVGIFLVNSDPGVNPHLLQENTFANNDLDVQRFASEQAL